MISVEAVPSPVFGPTQIMTWPFPGDTMVPVVPPRVDPVDHTLQESHRSSGLPGRLDLGRATQHYTSTGKREDVRCCCMTSRACGPPGDSPEPDTTRFSAAGVSL